MAIKKTVATKPQKPVTQKEVVEVVEVTQAVAHKIVENQPIAHEQEIQEPHEPITSEEIPITVIEEEEVQEPCFTQLEALRGIQANAEYYVVQLQISRLKELISFAEKNTPAPQRIQRDVNGTRVKALAGYVLANRNSHVLPAVTIVIEGKHRFQPYTDDSQYGLLILSEGTKLFPIDGQHRLLGLQHALNMTEDLSVETIPAMILKRDALLERRQAFFDINQLAKRVGAVAKAMDHRSPGTDIIGHVIAQDSSRYRILVFAQNCINYSKPSLTKKDPEIFSYTSLQRAIELSRYHIKNTSLPQQIEIVREYWFTVAQYMTDWQVSDPAKVRELTIATHGITLEGLGKLGRCFMAEAKELGEGKIDFLKKLSLIDWSKGNEDWEKEGILDKKGKIIASGSGDRICSHLIRKLGLPIKE
jgi:DNA sulfur modification protein DndB